MAEEKKWYEKLLETGMEWLGKGKNFVSGLFSGGAGGGFDLGKIGSWFTQHWGGIRDVLNFVSPGLVNTITMISTALGFMKPAAATNNSPPSSPAAPDPPTATGGTTPPAGALTARAGQNFGAQPQPGAGSQPSAPQPAARPAGMGGPSG